PGETTGIRRALLRAPGRPPQGRVQQRPLPGVSRACSPFSFAASERTSASVIAGNPSLDILTSRIGPPPSRQPRGQWRGPRGARRRQDGGESVALSRRQAVPEGGNRLHESRDLLLCPPRGLHGLSLFLRERCHVVLLCHRASPSAGADGV